MQDSGIRVHAWSIEERDYLRQQGRRGRRFAYPRLTPARTALVVIDMVPFFVDAHPYARGIVPNIAQIASRLRGAGATVAWVLPARRAHRGRR